MLSYCQDYHQEIGIVLMFDNVASWFRLKRHKTFKKKLPAKKRQNQLAMACDSHVYQQEDGSIEINLQAVIAMI